MPRRCASCGEPGSNVAAFCGRCGARSGSAGDPTVGPTRPRRLRGERSRIRTRDLVGVVLALGFVGLLAAGLEMDDAVGEVAVPATASGRPDVATARRPGASAIPAPDLVACGADPAPLCRRWARSREHDELVTADVAHVYLGDDRGTLTAFDRRDGDIRWSVAAGVGGLLEAEPVPEAVVVAGAGAATGDRVAAVDTSDGTVRWSISAADPVGLRTGSRSLLLLEPGRIRSVDRRSGTAHWTWFPADPHGTVEVAATTATGPILTSKGSLSGLDAGTGVPRWQVALPELRGAVIGGDGRLVAVEGSGGLVGMDADTGTVVWESRLAFGDRSAVQVAGADGLVVVTIDPPKAHDGSRTPRIVAVDPASGQVRWVHAYLTRVERRRVLLTPSAALLVGTTAPGIIASLDLSSGRISWQKELGSDPAHVRFDGSAVLAASGRTVAVLSAEGGSVHAEARLPSPVVGIVAFDGGTGVLRTTTEVVVVEVAEDGDGTP